MLVHSWNGAAHALSTWPENAAYDAVEDVGDEGDEVLQLGVFRSVLIPIAGAHYREPMTSGLASNASWT
jgi:hypothetical protein